MNSFRRASGAIARSGRGVFEVPVVAVFLPAFLASIIILMVLYHSIERSEEEQFLQDQQSNVALLRQSVSRYIESGVADASFLIRDSRVRRLLEPNASPDTDGGREVIGLFLDSRREYRSIELYDLTLDLRTSAWLPADLRTTRSSLLQRGVADPSILPRERLPELDPDDSDIDFALNAMTLPAGGVVVSGFDWGSGMNAARCFIRVGMAVPGGETGSLGALVLSVYVDELSERVGRVFGPGQSRAIIRDPSGSIMTVSGPGDFHFEFDLSMNPALTSALEEGTTQSFIDGNILFSVEPYYVDQIGTSAAAREAPGLQGFLAGHRVGDRWMIGSIRDPGTLQDAVEGRLLTFAAIGLAITAALAFGTLIVGRVNRARLAVRRSLEQTLRELAVRNSELDALNAMGEVMQTCETAQEIFASLARYGLKLFPGTDGALYFPVDQWDGSQEKIDSLSLATMSRVAAWGSGERCPDAIDPGSCWAYRRGRTHVSRIDTPEPECDHGVTMTERTMLFCCPLAIGADTLGILLLRVESERETEARSALVETYQGLLETVASRLTLSLSNVRLRRRLTERSIRDQLTGLFNRRYLEETLDREIDRSARALAPLGLIMLDIDHFKTFNDTWGHEAGDRVLQVVGRTIAERIRSEDVACRYGGEEFTIILPGAGLEAAADRAEELRAAISVQPTVHAGQELTVTGSFGVSVYPEHGMKRHDLLRAADAALYESKRAGRNRVTVAV